MNDEKGRGTVRPGSLEDALSQIAVLRTAFAMVVADAAATNEGRISHRRVEAMLRQQGLLVAENPVALSHVNDLRKLVNILYAAGMESQESQSG